MQGHWVSSLLSFNKVVFFVILLKSYLADLSHMVTIRALGKDFTLKNNKSDQSLSTAAKRFQEIIDRLELSLPDINRDKLLIIAGLELARQPTADSSLSDEKIEKWTLKLEEICDKIDLSIKESL